MRFFQYKIKKNYFLLFLLKIQIQRSKTNELFEWLQNQLDAFSSDAIIPFKLNKKYEDS